MFWKLRKKSIIISAELHDKIAQSSPPLYVAGSEVVRIKRGQDRKKKRSGRSFDPLLCLGS